MTPPSASRTPPQLRWGGTLIGPPSLSVVRFAKLLSALMLAGCAQTGSDEPSSLSRTLKIRTSVPAAPDFVARTRPSTESVGFIPVHARRVEPPGRPLTPDEIRAKERELDSLRAQQDGIAGRPSPPPAARSVADGGAQKRRPPAPIRCVLTCPDPATVATGANAWAQPTIGY